MARGIALLGLASLLLGLANGQKPGESKEVHPKITTYRCSKKHGCKAKTNYIVLDSLTHPVHQVGSTLGCGDWGNPPNATVCPTKEACAKNCIMEGIPDYSQYGVTTSGTSLKLQQLLNGKLVSPRVYLLDKSEREYEMLQLTGNEFTFEVDATKLPCGMNSALYLSEMDKTGARSKLNPGGAYYGTGYCDAQCFTTPFINGVGNIEGKGSCCNEMDIWEANSRASHVAPHTCNKKGLYLCEGAECEFDGVCDKNGCAWNPYRVNVTDYYGNSNAFKVDTSRPFSVVTQFPANRRGKLEKIHRLYVQDGKVIESHTVDVPGLPKTDSMTDEFCAATGAEKFLSLGAMQGMGEAMSRGMVLAMSIWWDEGGNMRWLDSGEAGPCNATEGHPTEIVKVQPNPEVTYSNLRWGEIGSTYGKVRLCRPRA
ncbi:glycoside hydrolase family 7 protein [Parathielavia appendiculata]|uniref:Glucanase n=1 Tax=Parathielavia appendiculata TaxID=2587402 RepID=A0AAN6TR78_9PEZI|nr:glycoside hydrolase family 7 protein [Parathielavia appendiculata]